MRDDPKCPLCDQVTSRWGCPHGSPQPGERSNPWLRGFAHGALVALIAFAAATLARRVLLTAAGLPVAPRATPW